MQRATREAGREGASKRLGFRTGARTGDSGSRWLVCALKSCARPNPSIHLCLYALSSHGRVPGSVLNSTLLDKVRILVGRARAASRSGPCAGEARLGQGGVWTWGRRRTATLHVENPQVQKSLSDNGET